MFNFLKLFKPAPPVQPETYGWTKAFEGRYEKNGYSLYKGHSGWVLDKFPKYGPGVVCRFDNPLSTSDMEQANGFADEIQSPTRIIGGGRY